MRSFAPCSARLLCTMLLCFGGAGTGCNVLLDNREVDLIALDAAIELPDATRPREDARARDGGETDAGIGLPPGAPEASMPECIAREIERDRVPCGRCDKGARPRRRTCDASGIWSEWSFTGACEDAPVECEPGAVEELGTVACGPCAAGAATLKRRCDPNECTWSVPATDHGACQFAETHCSPGDIKRVSMQTCGACDKGTIVQMQSCTDRCEWGEAMTSGCMYLDNTCDPQGPTRYRCKPPRDPDTDQAYRETCFAADYGEDGDAAAMAIRCTFGSDDREPCSRSECPDCY